MNLIEYNGVPLEVGKVNTWSDRNIYSEDNVERLYRHVVLSVQFVINPAATTIPNINAMTADQIVTELKRLLLQQRRSLRVVSGGTVVIETPAQVGKEAMPETQNKGARFRFVDARGGPNPLHCDIISIHGTKTFVGVFAVETWLVNNDGAPARESALISNRWEMSNELDEQYFCTRVITGRAIFRADFMYELTDKGDYRQVQRKATDYLPYLAHPLPPGYKRERVTTRIASDGLTLNYTIVDVEEQTILDGERFIGKIEGAWQAGLGEMTTTGMVPYYASLVVRAWGQRGRGDRSTTRQWLLDACVRLISTFGVDDALKGGWYYSADATVDIVKKFAQIRVQYRVGGGIVENALAWLVRGSRLNANGGRGGDFPEDFSDLLVASRSIPGQQPFNGILGGGQQRLASQSLRDGNDIPSPAPITVTETEQNSAHAIVEADAATRARNETERRG